MSDKPYAMGDLGEAVKRHAPAAERNREPIIEVLADWLPPSGHVLEIASGTGQHAVAFAQRFPALSWQPSDHDPLAIASIDAWRSESGLPNLLPPLLIDASVLDWPCRSADVVLSVNMVHIAPWSCAQRLVEGASAILPASGQLILYGPWWIAGEERAPSNIAFDADLRARDPRWGLRRVEDFAALAAAHGLKLVETRAMPANNRMLRLVKG